MTNKPNPKILKHIRSEQAVLRQSMGYVWGYTNGRIYRISRVLYYMAAGLSVIMSFVIMLGAFMRLTLVDPGSDSALEFATHKYVSMAAIVIFIACIVLIALKKHLPALLLSLVMSITMIVVAYSALGPFLPAEMITVPNMPKSDIPTVIKFAFFHVIPLLIVALTALVMFVISFRDNREIKHIYETKMAKLYKTKSGSNMMTDEEWQKALEDMEREEKEKSKNKPAPSTIFSDK